MHCENIIHGSVSTERSTRDVDKIYALKEDVAMIIGVSLCTCCLKHVFGFMHVVTFMNNRGIGVIHLTQQEIESGKNPFFCILSDDEL